MPGDVEKKGYIGDSAGLNILIYIRIILNIIKEK
jgi:hypothetical protein